MEEEAGRNHRVKVKQLGDIYSDTADAFYLLGLDASVASVSERAVPVLILVRHLLVRIALMCGTDRLTVAGVVIRSGVVRMASRLAWRSRVLLPRGRHCFFTYCVSFRFWRMVVPQSHRMRHVHADDIAAKIPMQQITDYLLSIDGLNEPTKIIALHHAR
jgi:hypothetical protein